MSKPSFFMFIGSLAALTQGIGAFEGEQRAAFDLLRLERQRLEFMDPRIGWRPMKDQPRMDQQQPEHSDDGEKEGEEEGCRRKCNDELRMGMDMVKAHSAFGSIGVPSVVEQLDLQLFCRLDAAHDQCLVRFVFPPIPSNSFKYFRCGYQVQLNLRDFVCKRRREELISHLKCFTGAANQLKKECGASRCGPYTELEMSLVGIGQRCRTLLCDLDCTQHVLFAEDHCREREVPAAQYLLAYSQLQISSWLRQLLSSNITRWQQWPRSCARLICGSGPRGVDGGNCINLAQFLP